MTVSREVEAEIQRLSHAEGWAVGTIASELGVHHGVVERVLDAKATIHRDGLYRWQDGVFGQYATQMGDARPGGWHQERRKSGRVPDFRQ